MTLKVYLGGPINGCTDDEANGWRDGFRNTLGLQAGEAGFDIEFVDPMDRDYRGREDECVNEIVELDKKDIDGVNALVAYCWQPSWGTGMEILYAYDAGVDTIIVVVPEGMRVSPWLRYHSDRVVSTLDEAASAVLARYAHVELAGTH